MSTSNTYGAVSSLLAEVGPPPAEDDLAPAAAGARTRRTDGCNVARASWEDARSDRNVWAKLVLLIGLAAAVTVAYLVLQLTDLSSGVDKLKAAAAAGGTVISGGLTAWVVKRFNDAKAEVEKWSKLVAERCG